MFAVDFVDESACSRIFNALIGQGFIVCDRKTLFRIDPPLIITEDDFSRFVETFRMILNG